MLSGFQAGLSATSSLGVDKLDLLSGLIEANQLAVNGINAGNIKSHQVTDGIISFDDANTFSAALTIDAGKLANVLAYLKFNINKQGATLAFNVGADAYVFQNNGVNDTLVELAGVHVASVNHSGLGAGALWIV